MFRFVDDRFVVVEADCGSWITFERMPTAAAVGFDWAKAGDVLDKIEEEVAEVRREVESGATGDLSRAEEEMGDLLFAMANLSRKLGIELPIISEVYRVLYEDKPVLQAVKDLMSRDLTSEFESIGAIRTV